MKITPTEEQEHIAFMDWARLHPICKDYLIHIPNGGSRHPLEAKKLKRMGVKAGVSDFFLAYPKLSIEGDGFPKGVISCGMWMELKTKGGKLTITQNNWLARMQIQRYFCYIAYGCDDAIEKVKTYLGEK